MIPLNSAAAIAQSASCSILVRSERFLRSAKRPDRLWGPPSLQFNGKLVDLSLGLKQLRGEPDHSPPISAKFKNQRCYTSTPPHATMAYISKISCLQKLLVHRKVQLAPTRNTKLFIKRNDTHVCRCWMTFYACHLVRNKGAIY